MGDPPATFPYWDYPPPGPAALAMLPPSPARDRLAALLADGDADDVADWLAAADLPAGVAEVLRRGLRGEAEYDAVEVGRLSWDDHLGTTTTCVARRDGGTVVYRAWQDGELVGEHAAGRVPGGAAIRNLMVTGDAADDDYEGKTAFRASSAYHPDLVDFDGWDEPEGDED